MNIYLQKQLLVFPEIHATAAIGTRVTLENYLSSLHFSLRCWDNLARQSVSVDILQHAFDRIFYSASCIPSSQECQRYSLSLSLPIEANKLSQANSECFSPASTSFQTAEQYWADASDVKLIKVNLFFTLWSVCMIFAITHHSIRKTDSHRQTSVILKSISREK